MHRVTKDDCLDLPPKMRTVIPCKVSFSMDDYDSFQEAFTDLGYLKTESAIDWIKDFLASNDEKLVVFTYHVNVAEHIFYMLTCVDNNNLHKQDDLLTGSTTKQDRDAYISRFQNPKSDKRILILTLGVGSTGLNLQKANNVLMVETSFSPMEMLQAEDRVHRNGQTKSCSINYLVAENTFDNKLFSLLEKKMGMSNAVVDGDFNNDLNVFEELKRRSQMGRLLIQYEPEVMIFDSMQINNMSETQTLIVKGYNVDDENCENDLMAWVFDTKTIPLL